MTTRLNDVVVVELNGFVIACAWCCPRARLEQIARAHPAKVTHSMCPVCVEKFTHGAAA